MDKEFDVNEFGHKMLGYVIAFGFGFVFCMLVNGL
jgi:hypothetical protein